MGFSALVESGGGEAAHDYVRGDEVYEDETTLLEAFGVALVVGSLESILGPIEVVVGEVIAAKIVQEGDTLGCWKLGERGGLLIDVAEYLLSTAELTTMEEELQAKIRCRIYPSLFSEASVWFLVSNSSKCITTLLTKALRESFSNHIG